MSWSDSTRSIARSGRGTSRATISSVIGRFTLGSSVFIGCLASIASSKNRAHAAATAADHASGGFGKGPVIGIERQAADRSLGLVFDPGLTFPALAPWRHEEAAVLDTLLEVGVVGHGEGVRVAEGTGTR